MPAVEGEEVEVEGAEETGTTAVVETRAGDNGSFKIGAARG